MSDLRCPGVGRDKNCVIGLEFYFSRHVTDDEMRFLHEVVQRAVACMPAQRAPDDRGVVICKRGFFYRPDWSGYTALIAEAGRYDRAAAERHAANAEGVTVHDIAEFTGAAT